MSCLFPSVVNSSILLYISLLFMSLNTATLSLFPSLSLVLLHLLCFYRFSIDWLRLHQLSPLLNKTTKLFPLNFRASLARLVNVMYYRGHVAAPCLLRFTPCTPLNSGCWHVLGFNFYFGLLLFYYCCSDFVRFPRKMWDEVGGVESRWMMIWKFDDKIIHRNMLRW